MREESWLRRSWWRERTSWRSWVSRRRRPSWSFSIREAAEPEDRTAEENWAGLKSGERKAEKIGSVVKVSRADGVGGRRAEVGKVVRMELAFPVAVVGVVVAVDGEFLKVERRWSGDLGIVGEAMIYASVQIRTWWWYVLVF